MSALPATMMCVEIRTPGGPEALVPAERPVPQPRSGELLIKVAASGVNRPDLAQRAGTYPPPAGASDLPGLEAAGTVAAVGPGVKGWNIGDAICALTPGGSYAEYCAVPAPQCLPPPGGFDMLHAAALPENYFTVWHNLFERARLEQGESVLIHGGASGIGTTAIQLAKAFGAIVLGRAWGRVWVASTCSTSEVPMPKAIAPNAPCVEVCESPHTIVVPGWVSPCCGPIT